MDPENYAEFMASLHFEQYQHYHKRIEEERLKGREAQIEATLSPEQKAIFDKQLEKAFERGRKEVIHG